MIGSEVQIPHLAYPFRMVQGRFAEMVEQDSLEDIADCCVVICRTPVGSRIEEPEIGIPDPTFQFDNTPEIIDQVSEWEPRATLELIDNVVTEHLEKHIGINVAQTAHDTGEGE